MPPYWMWLCIEARMDLEGTRLLVLPLSFVQEAKYDISGKFIPEIEAAAPPTHLGLHHHADPPQRAGYTLADLLNLESYH